MTRPSNYDKLPTIQAGDEQDCVKGWKEIGNALLSSLPERGGVICVECYPGTFVDQIEHALRSALSPCAVIRTSELLRDPDDLRAFLSPYLGNDPVFGRMNGITIQDYFDPARLESGRRQVESNRSPRLLVIGVGAALLCFHPDVIVYADLARWEIQQRWRRKESGNLGLDNADETTGAKYKCGFFVEWRAADRLKKNLLPRLHFLLDTNDSSTPKMIGGDAFRRALHSVSQRPFRVVPYFDPGPWGGHWIENICDLPRDRPNYAWGFDCVPEENSLLLGFGNTRVEVPAIDLVFAHPHELLGESVHARFGTEFPIRFDFLDTMGGGNLSFQVHPLTEYIQDKFGMYYTQDESYYMLDAGEDATVYLGLRDDAVPAEVLHDLRAAQEDSFIFPAERYANIWPAHKHDHFLIPAGTMHCSGKNSMVLEISATPYIFTFKLWDWGRVGLDGEPRPIHIDHGEANIQWDRTTDWVRNNLVNRIEPVSSGQGWTEERTGLHEREFIETRRHWFHEPVPHNTQGTVNVLNLVEGDEVVVESPTATFPPFIVHYAETFIVPAAVGAYTIRPHGQSIGKQCATIKAFVRTNA
jgi:mannose-6-phosphate isomerase class I